MRILAVCVPSLGHQRALVPLAAELVRRGHVVWIATGGDPAYAAASGAQVCAVLDAAATEDDLTLPAGAAREIDDWMLEHWFVPIAEQALDPTLQLAGEIAPDLILSDSTALWGPMVAERTGLPLAMYAPGLFMASAGRHVVVSDLTAPARPVSWRGAGGNGSTYWALERRLNRLRRSAGLPAAATLTATPGDLLLCFTTRRIEMDGEGLPPQARCTGPVFASRHDIGPPPGAQVGLPEGGGPLVYVSLGNVNAGCQDALRAAVGAVRQLGLRAVLANPRGIPLDLDGDPRIVEARGRIAQGPVLSVAQLLLGSGGFNTVHEALCHGVPVVAMPISGDEPALGHRLQELTLGRVVPDGARSAGAISRIVDSALGDARMARETARFATEARLTDPIGQAADHIELLANPAAVPRRPNLHAVEALPEKPRFAPRFLLDKPDGTVALRSATETITVPAGTEANRVKWLWAHMDGETALADLLAREPEPQGAAAVLGRLAARGVVEEAPPGPVSRAQDPRYARQLAFFSHFGAGRASRALRPERLQEKLLSASVLIAGLGSQGSNLAWRLAGAGIGELLFAGKEVVTQDLLGQGAWYAQDDIGRPAAEALAERVRSFRTDISASAVEIPEDEGQLPVRCDLAVVCPDAPDRQLTARVDALCQRQGLTWTSLRRAGFAVQIGPTVVPRQTACFNCFEQRRLGHLDDPAWLDAPTRAGLNLALGVDELTGEVVKYLTGCGEVCTLGTVAELDPFAMTLTRHRIFRLPRCPRCGGGRAAPSFSWRPGA